MSHELLPYAPVILKLLQGVLYHDDKQWETLLSYAIPVQRHFAAVGLSLHLDEAEGYAYLTQPDGEEEGAAALTLPRLVRRSPLTFDATLLCVLLREALQEFQARDPGGGRLVLSGEELREKMRRFYRVRTDMTRLDSKIASAIRQVAELGFLKLLNNPQTEEYEVRRILKAKLPADGLVEIRDKLQAHLQNEEE